VIEFRLAAVIERVRDDGPTLLPAQLLHHPRLLRPTRLTAADERLRDLAADIAARPPRRRTPPADLRRRRPGDQLLLRRHLVTTTAPEALAAGAVSARTSRT